MPSKKNTRTVTNWPTDAHSGSIFGLMRPIQWQFQSGNREVTPVQRLIWRQWTEDWTWVGKLRKKSRLITGFGGDAVEGNTFGSNELVTSRMDEQSELFIDAMNYGLKIAGHDASKGDLLYMMKGTGVHVGESENKIAKDLDAVPAQPPTNVEGQGGYYPWGHLYLDVNGVLFDVAHKGQKPGKRYWTTENGLMLQAKDTYFRCLDEKFPIPNYVISGHWHNWVEPQTYRGKHGSVTVVALPCYKAKDDYATEVARESFTNIGRFVVVVEKDGSHWWDKNLITIKPEIVKV